MKELDERLVPIVDVITKMYRDVKSVEFKDGSTSKRRLARMVLGSSFNDIDSNAILEHAEDYEYEVKS